MSPLLPLAVRRLLVHYSHEKSTMHFGGPKLEGQLALASKEGAMDLELDLDLVGKERCVTEGGGSGEGG